MSHVATVDVEIKNLEWLAQACQKIGLEWLPEQTTYRWFGVSVGDFPLPAGFSKEELGHCDHAIGLPTSSSPRASEAYQIGVVKRRDGRPGWSLLWDFYEGGKGLQNVVGEGCCQLIKSYTSIAVRETALRQGLRVSEQQLADGSIRMTLST